MRVRASLTERALGACIPVFAGMSGGCSGIWLSARSRKSYPALMTRLHATLFVPAGLLVLALASPLGARDLPRREAVRRATGCESLGEGFAKLEGSETCVKVSGSVRAEVSTSGGSRGSGN